MLHFGGFLEWSNCDIIMPIWQMSRLRLKEINSLAPRLQASGTVRIGTLAGCSRTAHVITVLLAEELHSWCQRAIDGFIRSHSVTLLICLFFSLKFCKDFWILSVVSCIRRAGVQVQVIDYRFSLVLKNELLIHMCISFSSIWLLISTYNYKPPSCLSILFL